MFNLVNLLNLKISLDPTLKARKIHVSVCISGFSWNFETSSNVYF